MSFPQLRSPFDKKPIQKQTPAAPGGFQPAWAARSNTVIVAGKQTNS